MKLSRTYTLVKVLPLFSRTVSWRTIRRRYRDQLKGNYPRKIQQPELLRALIGAYILRLPNLETLGERFRHWTGSSCQSALSAHLDDRKLLELALQLLEVLSPPPSPGTRHPYKRIEIIDGMPLTIPITQRGSAPKYNNVAKGAVVIWSFCVNPQPGEFPLRLLGLFDGKINEGYRLRGFCLVSGILYLLDRGYYNSATCQHLLDHQISFIMRAKKGGLKWRFVKKLSPARRLPGGVEIKADELVELGGPQASKHPRLRLIRAYLPDGEDLYLVTSEYDMPVEDVLRTYRLRGRIEPPHRFMKNDVGLAHLYSFGGNGIKLQALMALITAGLLYMLSTGGEKNADRSLDDVLSEMRQELKRIRKDCKVQRAWHRNTFSAYRRTAKRSRLKEELHPPNC